MPIETDTIAMGAAPIRTSRPQTQHASRTKGQKFVNPFWSTQTAMREAAMIAKKKTSGSATTPRNQESLVEGVADSDSSTNGAATTNIHQTVAATRLANELRPDIILRRLTFDMSGGWRRAKPAGSRPLDGRVRPVAAGESKSAGERPRQGVLETFETLHRTLSHAKF